jgi:predicted adenine nucleotide alpha hydrolase (AANH) superfamily ATPase
LISEDLSEAEEDKLLSYLNHNKDVFAWFSLDLVSVVRMIIEHSLSTDPTIRPKSKNLRKMTDEKMKEAKVEVHHLLEAKFIEPIDYPTWLTNVVMVKKKNEKCRICIDFTSLNKACQKTTSSNQG